LKYKLLIITGGPGTGKTTFAMEFLYRGALLGEKGLMVMLEEKPDKLVENIAQGLDWKLEEQINSGNITLVAVDSFDWNHLTDILQSYITRHQIKRVVIDTLTLLKLNTQDPFEFRRQIIGLMGFLDNLDCTVLFTAEAAYPTREEASYSLEEFIVDGVIALYNLPI
jgi:circadian clock protein KaiC